MGLELTKLVDGKDLCELGRPAREVLVFSSAINLPLERLELTGDLTVYVARTREMFIHALDLAQGAFLAAFVLGNTGGLFDKAPPLLGAALQNRIKLALGDDGVRVLA